MKAMLIVFIAGAAWAALSYLRMRDLNRILQKYQLELVDDKLIEALCLVAKANTKK